MISDNTGKMYELARAQYAAMGVDTEAAMARLEAIPISLHCWQGDDVSGFESDAGLTGGGIQATGNYPGRARNAEELRSDLDKALDVIPGKHRVNLHAIYAETGSRKVERNELLPEHFAGWIDWARANGIGLDFNPSFFSHPLADAGFTLTSLDDGIRRFWVEHGIACRRIGEAMGRALGTPCINNVWIADGSKDIPVDRFKPRELLKRSLDEIFAEDVDQRFNRDALESKLFGIGSECFVPGSHEFYMGYAAQNGKLYCMDAGHYHPTEVISDKISSMLIFLDEILLHVSRGVRWDSDHVVILNDELRAIAEEVIRNNFESRIHIGLDFFDASINRVAAWVIGCRSMLRALLMALLEPTAKLREIEAAGDYTSRLALLEELKGMPAAAVWDHYCVRKGVPVGPAWLDEVKSYESSVLPARQ